MAFVTAKEMLLKAQAGKYAVGAFNVENLDMIMAVIEAAESLKAPVILQTTSSTVRYASLGYFVTQVKVATEHAKVPVALHLDHGSSFELAMQALRKGYTSIMIDGSQLSYAENIALSKSVAVACLPTDVPVEAELGKLGGKEDDLEVDATDCYTDPHEAKEFSKYRCFVTSYCHWNRARVVSRRTPNRLKALN